MGREHSSGVMFLTRLGGGAFGNRAEWILGSMRRALQHFRDYRLDVRLVSFGGAERGLQEIADSFD